MHLILVMQDCALIAHCSVDTRNGPLLADGQIDITQQIVNGRARWQVQGLRLVAQAGRNDARELEMDADGHISFARMG